MNEQMSGIGWISVTKLPSGYRTYPSGVEVKYRPYTFGEKKELALGNKSEAEEIRFIMRGIEVNGMGKYDLTIPDYMYLALMRKTSTDNEVKFTASFLCDACGQNQILNFTVTDIKFKNLDVEGLPVRATLSTGKVLEFKPMTVQNYLDMIKEKPTDRTQVDFMARQVSNMKFPDAHKAIYDLSGSDEDLIDQVDKLLDFGITPMEHKCDVCGFINFVHVDLDKETLILPFRKSGPPDGSGISYGDEGKHPAY